MSGGPNPAAVVVASKSVGMLIRAELDRRGWTQTELAWVLDRPIQFVNEVCTDHKQLTRESAAQIAAALGADALWWLQRQDAHRLSLIDNADALCRIRLRVWAKPTPATPHTEDAGDRARAVLAGTEEEGL